MHCFKGFQTYLISKHKQKTQTFNKFIVQQHKTGALYRQSIEVAGVKKKHDTIWRYKRRAKQKFNLLTTMQLQWNVTFATLTAGSHIGSDPDLLLGASRADIEELLSDVQIVANSQLPNSAADARGKALPPQISGLPVVFAGWKWNVLLAPITKTYNQIIIASLISVVRRDIIEIVNLFSLQKWLIKLDQTFKVFVHHNKRLTYIVPLLACLFKKVTSLPKKVKVSPNALN